MRVMVPALKIALKVKLLCKIGLCVGYRQSAKKLGQGCENY
ncbi:MAG: hypothetical protein ACI9RO_002222 [Alteromonas macleodii]|jgi:hypothetical protein